MTWKYVLAGEWRVLRAHKPFISFRLCFSVHVLLLIGGERCLWEIKFKAHSQHWGYLLELLNHVLLDRVGQIIKVWLFETVFKMYEIVFKTTREDFEDLSKSYLTFVFIIFKSSGLTTVDSLMPFLYCHVYCNVLYVELVKMLL